MTFFFPLLDAPVDEKAHLLKMLCQDGGAAEVSPDEFRLVPGSPFSYWCSSNARRAFQILRGNSLFERVFGGISTLDDGRFLRLAWEVVPSPRWLPLAKGGEHARFYADLYLLVPLGIENGREIAVFRYARRPREGMLHRGHEAFGRAGVTWSLRTQRGLSMRALPEDSIFSHKGPSAFVPRNDRDSLLAALAITNSHPFRYLVAMQMAFGSYEVGVIERTPMPALSPMEIAALARLARRAWSLKRSLDTTNEISHAFVLPGGVNKLARESIEQELLQIEGRINDEAFRVYGIDADDRALIESSTSHTSAEEDVDTTHDIEAEAADDADDGDDDAAVGGGSDALASWLLGVAFGRFDPRLATGERAIPPEPEPFDPLPARAPGMYPEGEEPADRPDILVDDEGHADDLAARVVAVAERVKVDVPENLRAWLAKEFFPLHIKMYSKSRRKAPIYWQLATPSATYSVLLYIYAFSKDTLFRIQNDYVVPKLAHEERRLESLTSELRDGASSAQRKQLAAQEALVEELRAFLDEVKRVAPLWNPNLDDGVIINFAPLWRLVPQNKSWQKELKSTWDALCEGKYDWAHLAMHLWPERVVPKCVKDRSLAIAHGVEEVFWMEGTDGKEAGKWTARKTPSRSVDELVRERTSPAVKAALKSLLEAPASSGAAKKTRRGRTNA